MFFWPTWIRSEKFSGRSDVVCDTGKADAAVAAAKHKAAAVKVGLIIARVPLFRPRHVRDTTVYAHRYKLAPFNKV